MKIVLDPKQMQEFKERIGKVYPHSKIYPSHYFTFELISMWKLDIDEELYNYVMNYDTTRN